MFYRGDNFSEVHVHRPIFSSEFCPVERCLVITFIYLSLFNIIHSYHYYNLIERTVFLWTPFFKLFESGNFDNHQFSGELWCQSVQYLIVVTALVSIYTLVLMSVARWQSLHLNFDCLARPDTLIVYCCPLLPNNLFPLIFPYQEVFILTIISRLKCGRDAFMFKNKEFHPPS